MLGLGSPIMYASQTEPKTYHPNQQNMNKIFQPVLVVMTVAMVNVVLMRVTVMTMMNVLAPFSVATITVEGRF